jgi:predicted membrane-bound dolichyl-phosphate-mannose-protein mannosyltransferase
MLDIFVAFFIALSIWFALEKKYSPSAFFIGVASSCKLTGVFPLAALLLIMTMRRSKVVRIMLCVFAVPLLVWLSFNLPLIVKWGFQGWLNELTGSLSWFLASRPPGPSVSTPWGWFVNENPFVLNNGPDVVASVNVAVYSMALVALILVPYLTRGANRNSVIPVAWFIFNFLGYVLVYVLGNRTLYSFYVVTFSPMAYILACSLVHLLSQGLEKRYGGLLFRHKRRMSSLKIFSPISTTAGGLSRS